MTDDFDAPLPVTAAELNAIEAYLGDMLDDLFGKMAAKHQSTMT